MDNRRNKLIVYLLAIVVLLGLIVWKFSMRQEQESFTYDQLIGYVKSGEITKIEVEQNKNEITVTLQDGTQSRTVVPSIEEFSSFISKELENGSNIEVEVKAGLTLNFSTLISLITLGCYFIIFKGVIGSSGDQLKPVKSTVTFNDIAGLDEERGQFEEIVQFLKDPKKYEEMGAKIPKGILLYGEPGTGKTFLAKAIAGEAGVPFFQMSGSAFEEKFVGVGASRVRRLFKKAKSVAPAIVFIDEIDAVAVSRYSSKSYSEQTLNQLLTEMDGFDSSSKVIVIAATNCKDVLDPAITRAGRFDRKIFIPKPDVASRKAILEIHAKNKKLSFEISLKEIAKKTVGFSGADLENILNEAAIFAVGQGKAYIDNSDIDEAIARVLVGLEKKNASVTAEDKKLTAIHEAGHAIVSAIQRPNVRNFGISIVQRGYAGGYNYFDNPDAKYSRKEELKKQISVLYGGRVAEEILLGDISSGASNDLERASQIAYMMVNQFGMDGKLMVQMVNQKEYSEELAQQRIDAAENICQDAYNKAKNVVITYRSVIEKLAELLFEKESLSQEEVESFLAENLT